MHYIKEVGGGIIAECPNLERAISSIRYLADRNKKQYEILSIVYTTYEASEKDYLDHMQNEINKYGSD